MNENTTQEKTHYMRYTRTSKPVQNLLQ